MHLLMMGYQQEPQINFKGDHLSRIPTVPHLYKRTTTAAQHAIAYKPASSVLE